MLFDLHQQQDMSPTVSLLFSAVNENFNRLKSIIAGMDQDELDYKGIDEQYNSTAQLLQHLIHIDVSWVYRIQGEELPSDLKECYGPMIDVSNKLPMIKDVSLHELVSRYEHVIEQLRLACMQLTEQDLAKTVWFGHSLEKQATIRWGIWHIADHSRYHQAHINQLRKWYQSLNT